MKRVVVGQYTEYCCSCGGTRSRRGGDKRGGGGKGGGGGWGAYWRIHLDDTVQLDRENKGNRKEEGESGENTHTYTNTQSERKRRSK